MSNGRRPDGTFDGTAPPKNGGRRALPWDLLDGHIDAAWGMLVACATGEVTATCSGNFAVRDMAREAPPQLRLAAAQELINRVHGKAPNAPIDTGAADMSPAVRALLALAMVETKGSDDG